MRFIVSVIYLCLYISAICAEDIKKKVELEILLDPHDGDIICEPVSSNRITLNISLNEVFHIGVDAKSWFIYYSSCYADSKFVPIVDAFTPDPTYTYFSANASVGLLGSHRVKCWLYFNNCNQPLLKEKKICKYKLGNTTEFGKEGYCDFDVNVFENEDIYVNKDVKIEILVDPHDGDIIAEVMTSKSINISVNESFEIGVQSKSWFIYHSRCYIEIGHTELTIVDAFTPDRSNTYFSADASVAIPGTHRVECKFYFHSCNRSLLLERRICIYKFGELLKTDNGAFCHMNVNVLNKEENYNPENKFTWKQIIYILCGVIVVVIVLGVIGYLLIRRRTKNATCTNTCEYHTYDSVDENFSIATVVSQNKPPALPERNRPQFPRAKK